MDTAGENALLHQVNQSFSVELMRGNIPMNIAKKPRPGKERPLLHTTSVRNGTIGQQFKTTQPGRMLNGPAVLLPRVGKPKLSKMVVFEPTEKTYISDCLIALRTVPEGEEKRLHNILRDA
jgi:hypothetical protein